MKATDQMQALLASDAIGKVFADQALLLDAFRRESLILREMLQERGLTQPRIRKEVRKRVKYFQQWEEASALFYRVCQRTLEILHESDSVMKIAENFAKTKKAD